MHYTVFNRFCVSFRIHASLRRRRGGRGHRPARPHPRALWHCEDGVTVLFPAVFLLEFKLCTEDVLCGTPRMSVSPRHAAPHRCSSMYVLFCVSIVPFIKHRRIGWFASTVRTWARNAHRQVRGRGRVGVTSKVHPYAVQRADFEFKGMQLYGCFRCVDVQCIATLLISSVPCY